MVLLSFCSQNLSFKSQLLFKFIYWDINKLLGFLPARPGFDIYETNPRSARRRNDSPCYQRTDGSSVSGKLHIDYSELPCLGT